MAPEAAGTRRADPGWGIGDAVLGEHRGAPPRGVPARSQPEEFRAAASGGEQGPKAANPRGKKKSLHAVEEARNRAGESTTT
jgi:hypothetical protein